MKGEIIQQGRETGVNSAETEVRSYFKLWVMLVEKHGWKLTGSLVMVMRSPELANRYALKLGFHSPTQTRIQRVVLIAHSCLTLCEPMDNSQPGFSVHGILQARILEWVSMPSSRGSS